MRVERKRRDQRGESNPGTNPKKVERKHIKTQENDKNDASLMRVGRKFVKKLRKTVHPRDARARRKNRKKLKIKPEKSLRKFSPNRRTK